MLELFGIGLIGFLSGIIFCGLGTLFGYWLAKSLLG